MKAVAAAVLWWLVCAATSVSCCPGGCSCRLDQGLYSANCSNMPRTGGKVEALTVLRAPEDEPIELTDGQFMAARHLKYLSLRNSSIYYVHKKAFYGAKSLVEIDLSFNYLEEFEPTVFQQLTQLTTLVLRGNAVQLTAEVPFLISNSLQHLDLGQCQIRSLPRGVFYGLKRLKYLYLNGNHLKSLEYNSLPKGLKFVDLSSNHIANVPAEVLSTLSDLRRVGLGGNPVNCSCSLLNLQDWLSGRGVVFENDVTCHLPAEYYGVSWSKVDENRVCLEEARREQLGRSFVYPPLFKNKLYKGNYFDNENSYMGESIQSDQPLADNDPNAESEVLFQNDDTLAMGEMMRNGGDKKEEEVEKSTMDSNNQPEEGKTEPPASEEDKTEPKAEEEGKTEPKAKEEDKTEPKAEEEDKTEPKAEEEDETELKAEEEDKTEPKAKDEDKTELKAEEKDKTEPKAEDEDKTELKAEEEDNTEPNTVEEDKTEPPTLEEEKTDTNTGEYPSSPAVNDKETATVSKAEIQEEEFGLGKGEQDSLSHGDNENANNQESTVEGENALIKGDDEKKEDLQSSKEPVEETNLQDVLESPSNNAHKEEKDTGESLVQRKENEENTLEVVAENSHRESLEETEIKPVLNEENTDEKVETHEGTVESFNLNDNHPLEYKPINEQNENDPNSEADVIKQEGLYPVKSEKYSLNISSSVSTEEPPILPTDDTTDDEVGATDIPEVVAVEETSSSDEEVQNVTLSTTEISPTTPLEVKATAEIVVTSSPLSETTPEAPETEYSSVPSVIPDNSEPDEEMETAPTVPPVEVNELETKLGNGSLAAPAMKGPDEKVRQVAGAEVVMFCIAVLITCLILYSIFKCRTSNKRSNTRTMKDMESNRGTEMQDMDSLLPKPEDEQKKDLKYPTKAESSETMKLINENHDNEPANITPVANSDNHINGKNSLNNNSPLSQNGKTPLIKPDGPAATINPVGPIQRTKAKVGIIPDSIPQTPILIQKSYTNGTKRV